MVFTDCITMKIIKNKILLTAWETEEWKQAFERLADPEKVVIMDIETTGFSRSYDSVYLIGYLYYENQQFWLEQHLAESLMDEMAVLESHAERMDDFELCVTFNGEMFDHPFIESRWSTLHIRGELPEVKSCDLLRRYRPYSKIFEWPNCKLKTIEAFLGIDREDEFDGGQLIEVFYEYARTNDPQLEKVLLLHNYEDILNMPRLLRIESFVQKLREADVEEIVADKEWNDECRFRVVLKEALPLSYEGDWVLNKKRPERMNIRTEAGSPVVFIRLPKVHCERQYYLPNPEDYYYIPRLDTIVHRSLADTMDTTGRKAATRKNCCICRQGDFIVGSSEVEGIHNFHEQWKSAVSYYEKEELVQKLMQQDPEFLSRWFRSLFAI